MASAPPQLLLPGTAFCDRYEVVRCIKAGGMGAIYEAIHRATGRRLALKTMLPSIQADADLRARFDLEARIAASIESEHVVEIVDAGVDPETGLPFLAMELLVGEDLDSILADRGPLPFSDVVLILHQVALVLDRTHRAKILHRDLKPENLFVTQRDDGSPRIKLLDFGIAKVIVSTTRAKTTRNIGTPLYMSPEQMRGDGAIGPRSDLYSLGHLAFTLLTGESYWKPEADRSSNYPALLLRILDGPPEPPRERAQARGVALPAEFDAWFERAAALDPNDRFPSAADQVEALARALGVSLPHPHLASFSVFLAATSAGAEQHSSPTLESAAQATPDEHLPSPRFTAQGSVLGQRPRGRSTVSHVFVTLGLLAAGAIAWWAFRGEADDTGPTDSPSEETAPHASPAEHQPQPESAVASETPDVMATGGGPAAPGSIAPEGGMLPEAPNTAGPSPTQASHPRDGVTDRDDTRDARQAARKVRGGPSVLQVRAPVTTSPRKPSRDPTDIR